MMHLTQNKTLTLRRPNAPKTEFRGNDNNRRDSILQKFSICRSLDFTFLARCDDVLNLDVYLRLLRMISFHLSNDIAQIFDNDVFRVSLTRSESG